MRVQILWQGQKEVLTIVEFECFDIFYFLISISINIFHLQ